MKHSDILRLTKEELWDGVEYNFGITWHSEYICNALYEVSNDLKKIREIKKYINKCTKRKKKAEQNLVDNIGLQGWLQCNGIDANHGEDMQYYRQRFLDELIRRYEEVGK